MTDPLRALESLRDIEVPVGARSRVRARVEAHLDRRAIMQGSPRRRWLLGFALVAPIAVVALIALWPRSDRRAISVAGGDRYDVALPSGHVSIRGPAEVAVTRGQLSLVQGTVDAQGQLRVNGPTCAVVVQGSAEVSVKGAQTMVRVFAGSVEIIPPVATCEVIELQGGPITASVGRKLAPAIASTSGAAPAISDSSSTRGAAPTEPIEVSPSIQAPNRIAASPPQKAPSRIESPSKPIEPPARSSENEASMPVQAAAPVDVATRASVDSPPPTSDAPPPRSDVLPNPDAQPARPVASEAARPDPLAAEVAAFRAAVALEASNLAAARQAWQAWRARWSTSPLAQSVDLHLLAVLDRLGRHDEASKLARDFVRRYPRSPRRAEVERLIEAPR